MSDMGKKGGVGPGHEHGEFQAEAGTDVVDYGKVVGVGVASLVIFALAITWAGYLMHWKVEETQSKYGKAREFDTHQEEIGIVDQVPFSIDKRLPKWRQARKVELETYGWVDKSRGVVRIPIEEAMQKVAGGAMPAGAPR
jgi:hypothetical protein